MPFIELLYLNIPFIIKQLTDRRVLRHGQSITDMWKWSFPRGKAEGNINSEHITVLKKTSKSRLRSVNHRTRTCNNECDAFAIFLIIMYVSYIQKYSEVAIHYTQVCNIFCYTKQTWVIRWLPHMTSKTQSVTSGQILTGSCLSANFSSFLTNMKLCSLKTSTKFCRMEKWNVGVSSLRLWNHFSPVLGKAKETKKRLLRLRWIVPNLIL